MLFNCMCFQLMTIPGNTLPKFFSVPWDKAPPATPTTPSVYLWFCILSGYDDVFSFGANVFASKAYQHSGSRNTAGV